MKAILVIDLPEGMDVQDFRIDEVRLFNKNNRIGYVFDKYEYGPLVLKDIPNEEPFPIRPLQNEHETGWVKGWNACIKEIVK